MLPESAAQGGGEDQVDSRRAQVNGKEMIERIGVMRQQAAKRSADQPLDRRSGHAALDDACRAGPPALRILGIAVDGEVPPGGGEEARTLKLAA